MTFLVGLAIYLLGACVCTGVVWETAEDRWRSDDGPFVVMFIFAGWPLWLAIRAARYGTRRALRWSAARPVTKKVRVDTAALREENAVLLREVDNLKAELRGYR